MNARDFFGIVLIMSIASAAMLYQAPSLKAIVLMQFMADVTIFIGLLIFSLTLLFGHCGDKSAVLVIPCAWLLVAGCLTSVLVSIPFDIFIASSLIMLVLKYWVSFGVVREHARSMTNQLMHDFGLGESQRFPLWLLFGCEAFLVWMAYEWGQGRIPWLAL